MLVEQGIEIDEYLRMAYNYCEAKLETNTMRCFLHDRYNHMADDGVSFS